MTWRPIETAPKDGTQILGLWVSYLDGQLMQPSYGVVWNEGGSWLEAYDEVSQPTHWMPLPEPPQVQP
jgi:hypothetical protein